MVNLMFDDAEKQNADGRTRMEQQEEFLYIHDATNRWRTQGRFANRP
jgi:hypothetical protein